VVQVVRQPVRGLNLLEIAKCGGGVRLGLASRAHWPDEWEATAMSGRVVHFEIPFEDGDRAREFYREAFGWNITVMAEMGYTMVTSGPMSDEGQPTEPGFINGGMIDRKVGTSTAPVVTVEVDDVDEALARIEKLGGTTVIGRTAVGGMGFSAYYRDTEGNVMGLWESAAPN
jgi:predicted enzyme related to lactoylglutathione lyase